MNPNLLAQPSDWRTRIERDLASAYATVGAECYYQGRPMFRINGVPCYCEIDVQWQHPEADGIVRCITDRCGVKLASSIKADWPELLARAKATFGAHH